MPRRAQRPEPRSRGAHDPVLQCGDPSAAERARRHAELVAPPLGPGLYRPLQVPVAPLIPMRDELAVGVARPAQIRSARVEVVRQDHPCHRRRPERGLGVGRREPARARPWTAAPARRAPPSRRSRAGSRVVRACPSRVSPAMRTREGFTTSSSSIEAITRCREPGGALSIHRSTQFSQGVRVGLGAPQARTCLLAQPPNLRCE